jgi:3-hydroxybutyryl-CoA dehydratase
MKVTFDNIKTGDAIEGPSFSVSRESIRLFCDASLDYNPLHLDDEYMKGSFGKTTFGGIIMHGMNNFGLISRMMTDWAYPAGAIHRRLETRWRKPVKPGDTIKPTGVVKAKQVTVGRHRRGRQQPERRAGRDWRGHGRIPHAGEGQLEATNNQLRGGNDNPDRRRRDRRANRGTEFCAKCPEDQHGHCATNRPSFLRQQFLRRSRPKKWAWHAKGIRR